MIKIEWNILDDTSWWLILSPAFFADMLNAYFSVIAFIRMHKTGKVQLKALNMRLYAPFENLNTH